MLGGEGIVRVCCVAFLFHYRVVVYDVAKSVERDVALGDR
jgi:hypothetical protein